MRNFFKNTNFRKELKNFYRREVRGFNKLLGAKEKEGRCGEV